jgi:hypothetical protein
LDIKREKEREGEREKEAKVRFEVFENEDSFEENSRIAIHT